MSYRPVLGQEYKEYLAGKRRSSNLPHDRNLDVAAYGVNPKDEAIFGPVDWDQFYPDWDKAGKEYREQSLKTRFNITPLIAKHMKFLEGRGFKFLKKLGEGGYGQVWKVRATKLREATNENGEVIFVPIDLACKIVELKSFKGLTLKAAIHELKKEAELHKTLRHTNIVNEEKVINIKDKKSTFPQPIKVCTFMELCNGDLFSLINANQGIFTASGGLSEKETQQWFRDIVFGLRYLHDMDLAHLDIKPQNILYKVESDGSKVFKLADFGLVYDLQSGPLVQGVVGTPYFMAPEMGQQGGAHPKPCDIYSLGLSLSVSLSGSKDISEILIRKSPVTPQLIANISRKYSISEQVVSLIAGMVGNSANRLTIDGIIQHDWFTADLT